MPGLESLAQDVDTVKYDIGELKENGFCCNEIEHTTSPFGNQLSSKSWPLILGKSEIVGRKEYSPDFERLVTSYKHRCEKSLKTKD